MRSAGILRRLAVGCAFTVALASSAAAQSEAEVLAALRARERAADKLRVEFTWEACKADLAVDPFDKANWQRGIQHGFTFKCTFALLRPWFQWHYEGPNNWDKFCTVNWLDGQTVWLSLDEEMGSAWSYTVDKQRWEVHGPFPIPTPFEMTVCDVQESVADILARGEMRVESRSADRVTLVGHPTWQGLETLWTVRATYDPTRGWLPVEYKADMPRGRGNPKKIEWTMRTMRSVPVGGVHVISEAIFALSNGLDPRWQIYHYLASSVTRDESLTKADLEIPMPTRKLRLLNRLTGEVRDTNDAGEIIYQYWKTPEEVIEDQEAIAKSAAMATEARAARVARREVFTWLVGGAAALAVAAGSLWLWQRRRWRLHGTT